ncbi:hypothetical protein P4284_11340 [Bacillus swezeyi]|uniref:hypothetical protein n=1 Tax=Bacillus swezeyi TaxID=1925020 RepID=UPI002E1C6C49|nr:hypothetical protein [Bacillus swezeyi]MED2977286.1 hypothetical protein [Bacillus swezeyi]
MLSRWSFSFDEIFGAAIQPYFNLRERSETLFFTNQKVILIALALGVLLSCTAYSLQHSLPSITIAMLTITVFDHWHKWISSRLFSEAGEQRIITACDNGWFSPRLMTDRNNNNVRMCLSFSTMLKHGNDF